MKNKHPIFGSNVRRLRQEKGITQEQLGQMVGLSRRMVVHYEMHATHPPAEMVAAIANALGTTATTLLQTEKTMVMPESDLKFAKKLERAKRLPHDERKIIETMITSFLKKQKKEAA